MSSAFRSRDFRSLFYDRAVQRLLTIAILLLSSTLRGEDFVSIIGNLIDQEKLASLEARGANPRVQNYVYWLAIARQAGENPTNTARLAVISSGYTNQAAAEMTVAAMLRNLEIAGSWDALAAPRGYEKRAISYHPDGAICRGSIVG